jgi:biopolymer transport protein ExbB/TolQ
MPSLEASDGRKGSRPSATFAALLFGVPLATAFLALVHPDYGPLRDLPPCRYFKHAVEWVEVLLFCCALSALAAKVLRHWWDGRVSASGLLPGWDGKAVPAPQAGALLKGLESLPRRARHSLVGRRIAAALDFVRQRGTADGLDDQLRALADTDAIALEGSFSLVRFLTWAMPILGFLGTVLGITQSIAGITPERLENDLGKVTDGLAMAFDATALALGMTIVTMFVTFLIERAEQGALERVDRFVEDELAHRFERASVDSSPLLEATRQNTQTMLEATEALVEKQAAIWARTLDEAERQRQGVETRLQGDVTAALEAAMESTLDAHSQRLERMEQLAMERSAALLKQVESLAGAVREQQAAVMKMSDGIAQQTRVVAELLAGEKRLAEMQASLDRNLAVVAGSGAFEEALHSLTAAIHLLTARATDMPTAGRIGLAKRPGAAA